VISKFNYSENDSLTLDGNNISIGQIKLLGITRALLQNAHYYFFDEITKKDCFQNLPVYMNF
jgi:ABC-type transport system involved in cytochrome bd biosynthesis fused ATPase/permease subunit